MIAGSRLDKSDSLFAELTAIVGVENVFVDGETYDAYSHDATEIIRPPLAGISVTDESQVPKLIRLANQHSLPTIARGAGTGYTGGAIAELGGLVVSLARLNRIIDLDVEEKIAIVEPGVITQQLADAAAAVSLFYPPDPASVKECTIGGNIAECAGGLRCKKYGLTKDYVLGLEGFDSDGDKISTGYFATDQIYDLTQLLVGSEGTLAVITKIAIKLIDLPAHRRTFLVGYATQRAAAEVVAAIMSSGVVPAVLEYMDGDTVALTLAYLNWSDMTPSEATLLIELDGDLEGIDRDAAIVSHIVNKHSPETFEETAESGRREYLWTLRRSLSKAMTASFPLRVSEDVCVPPSNFPALIDSLPGLAKKYGIRVNSFGHAGDGNLHANFLMPQDTPANRETIHHAAVELFETTIKLEGTISGEHGIGITKKPYLHIEVPAETLTCFHKIKESFDPRGLINPGKMI